MGYPQARKNRFIALLLEGKDIRTIKQDEFNDADLKTLYRWQKLAKTQGHLVAKKSPGRPPKLNDRDVRHLVRIAKNNKFLNIKQMGEAAGVDACHKTLVKNLKAHNLQSFPMLKKPKLTQEHIRKRLLWAQEMRHKTLDFWKK